MTIYELDRLGIIAGPGETEEIFLQRAGYLLNLRESIHLFSPEEIPFFQDQVADETLREALPITQTLYGIAPTWLPLYFSNHGLSPWHGASAWIFQKEEDGPLGALIQLRKEWKEKQTLWGLYKRDEVVAHEVSHVGRMAFNEPVFEEFLAYRSSSSRFQRFLGPLLRSSGEAMTFVVILFLILFFDALTLVMGYDRLYLNLMWAKIIPLVLIGALFCRLLINKRIFDQTLSKLESLVPGRGLSIAYRLTDQEIKQLSKLSPEMIFKLLQEQSDREIRLKQLKGYLHV